MQSSTTSAYQAAQCPQCGASLPDFSQTTICAYCGARLMRVAPDVASSPPIQRGMKFTPWACHDPRTNLDVFQMLIPSGWQPSGGLTWHDETPNLPAALAFQVTSPNSPSAFEAFPSLAFCWTDNPFSQLTYPIGSFYYGHQVHPPLSAQQALREIVVPRLRALSGLRILQRRTPARSAQPGAHYAPRCHAIHPVRWCSHPSALLAQWAIPGRRLVRCC